LLQLLGVVFLTVTGTTLSTEVIIGGEASKTTVLVLMGEDGGTTIAVLEGEDGRTYN
jgi:hypothetical protein